MKPSFEGFVSLQSVNPLKDIDIALFHGFGPSLAEICNTLAAGLLLYSSNTCHSESIAGKGDVLLLLLLLLLSVVAVVVVVVVAQKQQALTPWANKVTTLQYAHSSPNNIVFSPALIPGKGTLKYALKVNMEKWKK